MTKKIIGAVALGIVVGVGIGVFTFRPYAFAGPHVQGAAPGTYQVVPLERTESSQTSSFLVFDTRTGIGYVSYYLRPQIPGEHEFQVMPEHPVVLKLMR